MPIAIKLLRARRDFTLGKIADGFLELQLVVVEQKIQRVSPMRARRSMPPGFVAADVRGMRR